MNLEEMRKLRDIQGQDGNWNMDEYMMGIYNGMELLLSVAEEREPVFKVRPEKFHKVLEFDCVITNGHADNTTLENREDRGWNFVTTIPAKLVHPKACETDKATIFSKYIPYPPVEDYTESIDE